MSCIFKPRYLVSHFHVHNTAMDRFGAQMCINILSRYRTSDSRRIISCNNNNNN